MIELNKIYNESNLDTMAKMPDDFVDMVITSPPYDNLRDYKGYSFPFNDIANELYRVMKSGGVLVWNVADATINGSESGTSFKQALYFMECGFKLHDTMIYAKKNYMPLNDKRYEQAFEYMFILVKGKINTFNPIKIDKGIYNVKDKKWQRKKNGEHRVNSAVGSKDNKKVKSNIWEYIIGSSVSEDKIAFNHPAIFPEKLAKEHIYSWSNKGDIIYDCFMGSGTSAKAAILLDRKFIGSELSADYVNIANERIKKYINQTKLF